MIDESRPEPEHWMRFALTFASLGLMLLILIGQRWGGTHLEMLEVALMTYAAICLWTLAGCYGLRHRGWLVEDRLDGRSGSSRLLRGALLPYLGLGSLVLFLSRRLSREDLMNPLGDGLWIGRLPARSERDQLDRAEIDAVLNLCWEFPRPILALTVHLPILDGSPPTPHQFRLAIETVGRWRSEGRTVLIHCAQGHGRSATVASAVLSKLGLARNADEALAMIQEVRPGARPSGEQRRALREYLRGSEPIPPFA